MSRSVTDRRSLWLVLSEFYLDVELNSTDYERIAQRITELGYDIKEARSVDYYEVAPVIGSNLLSVAGVWSGFD